MSHKTCTAPAAKKVYDGLKKPSDLLCQWRSKARTTASFFGRNEHLRDMKIPPLEGGKKKEDEPMCVHRDTSASLPSLWEELGKEAPHHSPPGFREP